ncbi:MAG: sugar kinase, partial [Thermoguttaceae bacterium]|nr:sugar kinase [Thermoguttaceae bacterium]
MTRIVAFGEVMARLKPAGYGRLRQTLPGTLEVTFGGAEANVAVSLAMLGADAAMVTALPRNPLGDACIDSLRGLGVDTRNVLRTDYGRLGLYFVEAGANQRPSVVVYDREHSSVSLTPAEAYAWDTTLAGANWLHLTGITPSLSRSAAEATIAAAAAARAAGATVSCDLNFRKKLWQWEKGTPPRKLAEATMRQVLAHTDLLVANEEDCADVLGIHASHTEVESGKLDWQAYPEVAREVSRQFPQLRHVAITLRQSISATHNNWAAMLYSTGDGKAYFSPLAGGELA